jgi:transposase-like protein
MLSSPGDISRGVALSHTTSLRWVMRYVPEL